MMNSFYLKHLEKKSAFCILPFKTSYFTNTKNAPAFGSIFNVMGQVKCIINKSCIIILQGSFELR